MKTLAAIILLGSLLTAAPAQAFVSAGVQVAQPAGFGGYLSYWPSDLISIDGLATSRVFDVGLTGHIPLTAAERAVAYDYTAPPRRPEHRLLLAGSFGRVHAAFDDYVVGTHLGAAVGYGYQAEWDLRLLAGVGGYNGAGWAWAPSFTALIGRVF